MSKTLFVIDLDGTVADARTRFAAAGREPSRSKLAEHSEWLAKVQNRELLLEDKAVPGMLTFLWAIEAYGASVIYLTAREEQWRPVTEKWLSERQINCFPLYMRPDGNEQPYSEFKRGVIATISAQQKSGAVVVLDDDPLGELQKVCKAQGWTFLKALSGGTEK